MASSLASGAQWKPHAPFRVRVLLNGCLAGFWLAVAAQLAYFFLFDNFHAILPYQAYRCAQLSAGRLSTVTRRYGIRTVINLRGWDPQPWYADERQTLAELHIVREDVDLVSWRLPWVQEARRLVDVLDHSRYPILLHCCSGADRTGLASVMLLLLRTDATLEDAQRQLDFRYGHFGAIKAGAMNRFFDLYAAWLADHDLRHTPALFRQWVDHDYIPGPYRCALEVIALPAGVAAAQPATARIRVHNQSVENWHFRAARHTGVHVGYQITGEGGYRVEGRSGLADFDVAPGQRVAIEVKLPPLPRPGRYEVLMDLTDEGRNWFFWSGSSPLRSILEVR